jgi:hypothetical protein
MEHSRHDSCDLEDSEDDETSCDPGTRSFHLENGSEDSQGLMIDKADEGNVQYVDDETFPFSANLSVKHACLSKSLVKNGM